MNLYYISQTVNTGYDTYDSAVVCAESEEAARKIHPDGRTKEWEGTEDISNWSWADQKDVEVTFIGVARDGMEQCVCCASFNAG